MSPESRIGKRFREEQEVRDDLARVLKKKKKRAERWKQTEKLDRKQHELETKKQHLELARHQELEARKQHLEFVGVAGRVGTDVWLTQNDLDYLEKLSFDDLCKMWKYREHRIRSFCHKASDSWVVTSKEYPYFPKYTFIYEIFRDKSWIDDEKKSELKEKAKSEVRKLVSDEIENDTFLYERDRSILEHIFEYIPQKTVANKLRWTWNMWTDSCVDVLWRHIDWFTELDEDYKKEIRREYNKKRGILDLADELEEREEEIEVQEDYEDDWEVEWWDGLIDAFVKSKRDDVKAFLNFMKQKEKDKRRFDDWLESEWGL